jgi:DNA-binding GntR family transcriptional regulator
MAQSQCILYTVFKVHMPTTHAQLVRLEAAPDLVDQVYRALRDAISDGSLAPGERLTQEDIAQRLAVSRQPVLQALRLLKKDGFVQDAPGRGVQVTPLDPDWIANVYQVRGALDALAAKLAAQHRYQIDHQLIAAGRRAEQQGKVQDMIEADLAFHQAIYQGACNPLIAPSAHQHWHHLRRVMGAVLQSSRQRESLWDEHEAIAQAIAAGDAARASELIEAHAHEASHQLTARLRAQLAHAG